MKSISRRTTNILCCLGIFSFFALFCLKGYVVESDSYQYILFIDAQGIMPIYPLLLLINRVIFKEIYLYTVIWEQAILAVGCIALFVCFLQRNIDMKKVDIFITYVLCLFPFLVNLPDYMMCQCLITEGIAYPIFYIFMIFFLKAVWSKKVSDVLNVFIMALFMAIIRSQLQILILITMTIPIFIYITNCRRLQWKARMIKLCITLIACAIGSLVGVLTVIYLNSNVTYFMHHTLQVENYRQSLDEGNIFLEKDLAIKEKLKEELEENIEREEKMEVASAPVTRVSQYGDLIVMCGMYEIDAEDIDLFKNEQEKKLFKCIYENIESGKMRYPYAKAGLWKWKDIANKKTGVTIYVSKGIEQYIDLYGINQYVNLEENIVKQMSITLLKAHWIRALLHTLQMMPSALISTVFFQISWCYLLCHLITFFVYLSATCMVIYGFKSKKIDNKYVLPMMSSLIINILMVIIITTIFIAMQRYLVYCFGIFYASYYILGKQILMQWITERKSHEYAKTQG